MKLVEFNKKIQLMIDKFVIPNDEQFEKKTILQLNHGLRIR